MPTDVVPDPVRRPLRPTLDDVWASLPVLVPMLVRSSSLWSRSTLPTRCVRSILTLYRRAPVVDPFTFTAACAPWRINSGERSRSCDRAPRRVRGGRRAPGRVDRRLVRTAGDAAPSETGLDQDLVVALTRGLLRVPAGAGDAAAAVRSAALRSERLAAGGSGRAPTSYVVGSSRSVFCGRTPTGASCSSRCRADLRASRTRRTDDPRWRATVALTAMCAVATLVNPFGVQAWVYVAELSNTAVIRRTITEWEPMSVSTFAGVAFFSPPSRSPAGWRGARTPWDGPICSG